MLRKRVDKNHQEIIHSLRSCGYSVFDASILGNGFPDIVVGAHGFNFLFEIKNKKYKNTKKTLTLDQKEFHESWKGQKSIIQSAEEAILIIKEKFKNV